MTRKTCKSAPRTMRHTLIELVVAMSLISFLISVIMVFFARANTWCRDVSTRAFANQQIVILKDKWRKRVGVSGEEVFTVADEGKKFISGPHAVEVRDGCIYFSGPVSTEGYRLFKGLDVSFSTDETRFHSLGVMNIELSGGGGRKETVRIVVCANNHRQKSQGDGDEEQ